MVDKAMRFLLGIIYRKLFSTKEQNNGSQHKQ